MRFVFDEVRILFHSNTELFLLERPLYSLNGVYIFEDDNRNNN